MSVKGRAMLRTETDLRGNGVGVFVMRCWVTEDGTLVGRVRWSTVNGDHDGRTLASSTDLMNEANRFLVCLGRAGQDDEER